jgi:hypothetical protein
MWRPTHEASLAHETSDTLAGEALVAGLQLGMDARRAVRGSAARVNCPNLVHQHRVGLGTLGWPTLPPGVVAARGDLQHATQ